MVRFFLPDGPAGILLDGGGGIQACVGRHFLAATTLSRLTFTADRMFKTRRITPLNLLLLFALAYGFGA